MKQYSLFFIVAIFLLASCEKEIEFKGGRVEPLLVLNGLLMPDSVVSIHLSESRFFLSSENEFKPVGNATVKLWKNGEAIATFSEHENGYYIAPYRSKTGDRLRITASAPGLHPVECSTEILPAPEILSAEITKIQDELFDHEVSLTLRDPAALANYYRLNLYLKIYFSEEYFIYMPAHFHSDDAPFSTTEFPMGDFGNRYHIFTDAVFNGIEYPLKLQVVARYDSKGDNEVDGSDSKKNDPRDNIEPVNMELYVDLQHITKDYYLYLKSRSSARGNDFGGMFSEPTQIFNNIQGGIGILGSYASTIYKFPLEIPPPPAHDAP